MEVYSEVNSREISQEAANEGEKCEGKNVHLTECHIRPCPMDVSVIGLIIGGCIILIIILISIVIYIMYKKKSHQNDYLLGLVQSNFSASTYPILSIEQKETVLMKLAQDENLNMLRRIEKSQLKIGKFLGIVHYNIYDLNLT